MKRVTLSLVVDDDEAAKVVAAMDDAAYALKLDKRIPLKKMNHFELRTEDAK